MTTAFADLTAFVLLLTITAYSVAGGVDYGAGIWDLLAGGSAQANRVRAFIDHAMAPVWEANNVWLVLAIVVCWAGFPLLFQSVFASLYPLFAVALLALILRGAFFAFRHVQSGPQAQRRMSVVFGISSVLAPFFFAAALGAIASGRVAVGEPNISVWQACFNPTSISFGLVSLAATAFIGASFLAGDARRFGQPDMVDYFRRRAVISTAVLIVIGTIALAVIGLENPHLLNAMLTGLGTPFAAAAVIVTPLVGFLVWRRRRGLPRLRLGICAITVSVAGAADYHAVGRAAWNRGPVVDRDSGGGRAGPAEPRVARLPRSAGCSRVSRGVT